MQQAVRRLLRHVLEANVPMGVAGSDLLLLLAFLGWAVRGGRSRTTNAVVWLAVALAAGAMPVPKQWYRGVRHVNLG